MVAPHTASLTAVIEKQKVNFCNRASALFPLMLSSRSDVRLLFLNYWRLKNGIERVQVNLRAYDATGRKVFQKTMPVAGPHHDFSMRELIAADMEGMVEIEFISLDNLVFAFPAVIALYQGDGALSAVHSAGRIRNPDEAFEGGLSEETNWICKYADGVAPFAHVFNGPRAGSQDSVLLRLYGETNVEMARRRIDGLVTAPFSSRLLCFDEIFSAAELGAMAFASVTLRSNEIFPRLVVGNYHRSSQLLEATHSFPHMGGASDYVQLPAQGDYDLLAYLSLPQPPELQLECNMYPTSAPAHLLGSIRATRETARPLTPTDRRVSHCTGGADGRLLRIRAEKGDVLTSVDFREGKIPARTTVCHAFRVRGASAPFSTDIAAGVSPLITQLKTHHWGHGVVSRDFETVILLNNVAYRSDDRKTRQGKLSVYASGVERSMAVSVAPESVTFVYLRDLLGDVLSGGDHPTTLSWLLRLESPGLDAYWVSFAKDGRICGDHAF